MFKRMHLSNKPFKFLWQMVRPNWLNASFLILAAAVGTMSARFWPYIVKRIIEVTEGKVGTTNDDLVFWIVVLIAAWVGCDICFRSTDYLGMRIWPKMITRTKNYLFNYTINNSFSYFANRLTGKTATKINTAANSVDSLMAKLIWSAVPSLVGCILTIGMMNTVHPWVMMVFVGWLVIHTCIAIPFLKKVGTLWGVHADAQSSVSGKIVDSITNFYAVKTFTHFENERSILNKDLQGEMSSLLKAWMYNSYFFWFQAASNILVITVCCVLSLYLYQQGQITLGDIALVVGICIMIRELVWDIQSVLIDGFRNHGELKDSLNTLLVPYEINDLPEATEETFKDVKVDFKDVLFHYPNGKKVFENLSFTLYPGERVGIVGRSGAGKSTLVNLLLRFYDIQNGEILFNGVRHNSMAQDSLREHISVVPQDSVLFHRSLKENISYGKPSAERCSKILL
jgi:ATP-binding cassette subfamily B protein